MDPEAEKQYDQVEEYGTADPALYPITMRLNQDEQNLITESRLWTEPNMLTHLSAFVKLARDYGEPGFLGHFVSRWSQIIAGKIPGVCIEKNAEGVVALAQNVPAGQTRTPA